MTKIKSQIKSAGCKFDFILSTHILGPSFHTPHRKLQNHSKQH